MKDIYLVNFSVSGIKSIKDKIDISFYKKTLNQSIDTQGYNIKSIYGINGSGKSAIITSIDILKKILSNPNYLNNPVVQNSLNELINKETQELYIKIEYLFNLDHKVRLYGYEIILNKNNMNQYAIDYEHFYQYSSLTNKKNLQTLFKVQHGEIIEIFDKENSKLSNSLVHVSTNLLNTIPLNNLFLTQVLAKDNILYNDSLFIGLCSLCIFSNKLSVYLEHSDVHTDYYISQLFDFKNKSNLSDLLQNIEGMGRDNINVINVSNNIIPVDKYQQFEKKVNQLKTFISIFKTDLKNIEIDKKINDQVYICNLIMVYDTYKISSEFESTGIKKLISLYAYLNEMVLGNIVFIDEFDANLHDVYLCALLEYLMTYAKGQLCFTTHNVGPMSVLKTNKNSIDFLSQDQKIYSWKKNGNYSPSNLYREGMIEGSPFNVDSIDFIGMFDGDEM